MTFKISYLSYCITTIEIIKSFYIFEMIKRLSLKRNSNIHTNIC